MFTYKQRCFLWLTCFSLLLLFSCKREGFKPLNTNSGDQPLQVSDVQVQNQHGGALITYALPQGENNIMYVQAQWSIHGTTYSMIASAYSDTIVLQGFGDTLKHEIKLYSISVGNKKSTPVMVTVRPLEAPVNLVLKSLSASSIYGGILVNFVNKLEAAVQVCVLAPDSVSGKERTVYVYRTKLAKDSFALKGYSPMERKFGFYVKDQAGNSSDTMYMNLKPKKIPVFDSSTNYLVDKSLWHAALLPNDAVVNAFGTALHWIWNGKPGPYPYIYHTNGAYIPHSFTIDLGKIYNHLTWFEEWGRQNGAFHNPDDFEVWGIADTTGAEVSLPTTDPDWKDASIAKGWTLLTEVKRHDDGTSGWRVYLIHNPPPVRFIRIRVLHTIDNTAYSHMSEISFWYKP